MVSKVNEMQQVGSRLSVCRQNRNMTQEELAYKLGITPQALSKWERGMSLPDTSILPDIARILEISTDYLLGISQQNVLDNGDCEFQRVIGENLRNTLQPLELVFGKDLISQFSDQKYVDEIRALRLKLSHGGFLLPVFRIRDELRLESKEFMILSYQNILYSETLGSTGENTLHYIVEKLGECIQEKYYEIINPDLLKALVDNLKIKYPVLTESVVPEKISYSRLTDMVKRTLRKGCSIAYLPKIIEIMDCLLNSQKDPSGSEAEEEIIREIKRADHFREVLERRK